MLGFLVGGKVMGCLPFYCRNRVCLLAGHLAGHMEDSRTPAFSTNPVLLTGRRAVVTPVPTSPNRCRLRGRLWPIKHHMLRLGHLCERLRQYHKQSALRRGSGCGRSGRCDGHSLPTGFPEITSASKHLCAWLSAGVFVMWFLTALQDRRLDVGCV